MNEVYALFTAMVRARVACWTFGNDSVQADGARHWLKTLRALPSWSWDLQDAAVEMYQDWRIQTGY